MAELIPAIVRLDVSTPIDVRLADNIQASNRVSDEAKKTIDIVAKFVQEECIP